MKLAAPLRTPWIVTIRNGSRWTLVLAIAGRMWIEESFGLN